MAIEIIFWVFSTIRWFPFLVKVVGFDFWGRFW
jgi:hypothetical protein